MPLLIGTLLFCLMATLAAYSCSLTLLAVSNLFELTDAAARIISLLADVLLLLLAVFLVMPLWLGRLRLAGLMTRGKRPLLRDLFYYFTSARRLCRAHLVGFLILLLFGVAILSGVAFFEIAFYLYRTVLTDVFLPLIAVLLLILLLLLALLLTLAVLALSCFFLLFGAIVVGNESLSVGASLRMAFDAGKQNFFALLYFSGRSLLWLLLSLVTVGVLQILYFSHFYILSYTRLAMALCPEEERT